MGCVVFSAAVTGVMTWVLTDPILLAVVTVAKEDNIW
jgi:hypothetical protein